VIVIRDSGQGLTPRASPTPPTRRPHQAHGSVGCLGLRVGGFGILMARGLGMSCSTTKTGNEVRLVQIFRQ